MRAVQTTLRVALLAAGALVALAGSAQAQINVSHHERVTVTPIRENGHVIGAKIEMVLRNRGGHDRARVGLGRIGGPRNTDHRRAASDQSAGHLVVQWPEVSAVPATPHAVAFEVHYGRMNNLRGGEKVEVVSAWNAHTNPTYWHVFGMQEIHADPTSVIELPTDATAPPAPTPAPAPATN